MARLPFPASKPLMQARNDVVLIINLSTKHRMQVGAGADGIQKLLSAEMDAQRIVSEARKGVACVVDARRWPFSRTMTRLMLRACRQDRPIETGEGRGREGDRGLSFRA